MTKLEKVTMYNIYSGLNLSTFDFAGLSVLYFFISSHQFVIVLSYFFQMPSKCKTFKTHRSLNIQIQNKL